MQIQGPHDESRSHHVVALHHIEEGQYHRAIEAYTEAIETSPSVAATYLLRALAYEHIGEHEKAREDRRMAGWLGFRPLPHA